MPTKPVRIAIRTVLVAALLLTAHFIKPFSFGNIAGHLLHSANSLSFVLPGQTRDSFNSANLLAISLTNLFFTDSLNSEWNGAQPSEQPLLAANLVNALNQTPVAGLPQVGETACRTTRRPQGAPLTHARGSIAAKAEEAKAEVAALSEAEESLAEVAETETSDLSEDVAVTPVVVDLPEAHSVVALAPFNIQPALACASKPAPRNDGKALQTQVEALLRLRSESNTARQSASVALLDQMQATESVRVLRLMNKLAASPAKCAIEEKPAAIETEASEAPVVEEKLEEIETKQEGLVMPGDNPFTNKCAIKVDWP